MMDILRALCLGVLLLASNQATAVSTAATSSFYVNWSGASWNNDAEAHGILTIDNASFPNPSDSPYSWLVPGTEIIDFSLTVSGAGPGNGTFQLTDFDGFVWDTVVGLDLTQELVGQETGSGGWGTSFYSETGDFNLVAAENSFAPTLYGSFLLMTNNDTQFGTQMNLVSFRPVPIPAAIWMFGATLLGLMGVGHKRGVQA